LTGPLLALLSLIAVSLAGIGFTIYLEAWYPSQS
jgi:hypothetical protein